MTIPSGCCWLTGTTSSTAGTAVWGRISPSADTHSGIWRLPFTDGLVDTNLHFLPSFTSGFYRCTDEDCEGAEVFVSRGLGNSPRWAFRLFNRPQVAVITLKKG